MSSYDSYKEKAIRSLRVADYMFNNTYPSVKEPKLLLAILDDIFVALTNMMKDFLARNKHEIDEDFMHLFSDFKTIARSYGFTDDDFDLIFNVHRIMHDHKEASVEFARKDKFVICRPGYKLELIGVDDINAYIFKSQTLLKRLETQ